MNCDTFRLGEGAALHGCMADSPVQPAESVCRRLLGSEQAAREQTSSLVALASDAAAPLAAERQQITITVKSVCH